MISLRFGCHKMLKCQRHSSKLSARTFNGTKHFVRNCISETRIHANSLGLTWFSALFENVQQWPFTTFAIPILRVNFSEFWTTLSGCSLKIGQNNRRFLNRGSVVQSDFNGRRSKCGNRIHFDESARFDGKCSNRGFKRAN